MRVSELSESFGRGTFVNQSIYPARGVQKNDGLLVRGDLSCKDTEQDFKCAIDGEELLMKDAQGAHKKAHAKGGKTNYKNLAMVRTCYNKDMGSMDLDDYKEFINDSKAA